MVESWKVTTVFYLQHSFEGAILSVPFFLSAWRTGASTELPDQWGYRPLVFVRSSGAAYGLRLNQHSGVFVLSFGKLVFIPREVTSMKFGWDVIH